MTNHRQGPTLDDGDARSDAAVESLLRLAGPREPVPTDRLRRLKAGAHADWRRQVAAYRRRRLAAWSLGALAAAALVVAVATTLNQGPGDVPTPFATVEHLGSNALLRSGDARPDNGPLAVGGRLLVGDGLLRVDGGIATLRLPGGALLMMADGSALQLTRAEVVTLATGAVYLDSNGHTAVAVRTRYGVVHDIGTQFEVRVTGADLRVRVRDGAVQVRREQGVVDATRGDEILLEASGAVTRRAIAVEGPDWAWTTGTPAPFELEGRSLREFLNWITGENGWRLAFADAAAEAKAGTTTLHGSIRGLTPEQALAAVLPTSGVEHELEDGVLSIRLVVSGKE